MTSVTVPAPEGFAPSCRAVPSPVPSPAAWVLLRGDELLIAQRDGGPCSLLDDPTALGIAPMNVHALGAVDGRDAFVGDVPADLALPEGVRSEGLRGAFMLLRGSEQAMAAYGAQVRHWDRTTRFCGECGRATEASVDPSRRAKRCAGCNHEWYPRVSPCVITLVYDAAGRVLLTRQASWPAGRYGLVAGFVEPGETLEDCVHRETFEETGVELDEVTYGGSQPWPFPHQLMVGFTARHVRGEPHPHDGELEDARWFSRDELPILPPRFSIARRLIDAYFAR